eukprot:365001-Chlamydomonas_euryale.AAC.14
MSWVDRRTSNGLRLFTLLWSERCPSSHTQTPTAPAPHKGQRADHKFCCPVPAGVPAGVWQRWFESSLASSLTQTALLFACSRMAGGRHASPSASGAALPCHAAAAAALVAAVGVTVWRIGLEVAGVGDHAEAMPALRAALAAVQMLGPPVMAAPAYRWLLAQLPGSFTAGEVAVVAQAGCLLAAAAGGALVRRVWVVGTPLLVLPFPARERDGGGAGRWVLRPPPWHTEREEERLFVLLVCFWALALAFFVWACAGALSRRRAPASVASCQANSGGAHVHGHTGGRIGAACDAGGHTCTACNAGGSAGAACKRAGMDCGGNGSRSHRLLAPRLRQAALAPPDSCVTAYAASCAAGGQAGPYPSLQLPMTGLGLLLCVVALADLALWALMRLLTARPQARVGTLVAWLAMLAAALPLMLQLQSHAPRHPRATAEGGMSSRCGGGGSDNSRRSGSGAAGMSSSGFGNQVASASGGGGGGSGGGGEGVPLILLRKGYHALALALFVPALLADGPMLRCSLAVAFAAMVFAEAVRAARVPRVSPLLDEFMSRFADERDGGRVYVTHMALLTGMAVPMWMAHAAEVADAAARGGCCGGCGGGGGRCGLAGGSGGWSLLVAASGLSCLGLGDSAASVVGVLAGRVRPFRGSRKTAEGTAAGAAAMLAGWAAMSAMLLGMGHTHVCGGGCGGALGLGGHLGIVWLSAATLGAALLEAVTHQLDNLIVPLYYAAHLLLLVGVSDGGCGGWLGVLGS